MCDADVDEILKDGPFGLLPESCRDNVDRNDTPQSVGRHLRDVYSSVLMIANDRILATNAQLLLVHKAT